MAIKTLAQIISAIKDYLETRLDEVDTSSNTYLTDGFIEASSEEISDVYDEVENIQKAQSTQYPDDISTDDMDALAYNWNLTRKGSTASQGFVTFSSFTSPVQNLRIGNSDGSGGIIVSTPRQPDGTVISFITTETVYLLTTTSIDPSTDLYSITAPIECTVTGEIGNVDAGLVIVLNGAVAGIDKITNTIATTGGKEEETNSELATRIKSRMKGLHYGIRHGIRSIAMEVEGVIDAEVVGPNDDEVVRYTDGGGADVYILGENLTSRQQSFTYAGAGTIIPDRKPVYSITSVTGVVGLTNTTFVVNTDYRFDQDTTSTSAYSTESTDLITWLTTGNAPDVGETCTVTYQYDKIIADIQDKLDQDNRHYIGADILAKRATKVLIDMAVSVTKVTGSVSTEVEDDVKTALSTYINNLLLGEDVEQSDLINEIKDISDVDNVSFTSLYKRTVGSGLNDTISISKLQYARTDANSITVTIS